MVAEPSLLDDTHWIFSGPHPTVEAFSSAGSGQFVSIVAAVIGNGAVTCSSVVHITIFRVIQVATPLAYTCIATTERERQINCECFSISGSSSLIETS